MFKSWQGSGEDDIQPEMSKAMNNFGVYWLTCMLQAAWKTGEVLKQWQINVLISIYKKGDKEKCTNYRLYIMYLNRYVGVDL